MAPFYKTNKTTKLKTEESYKKADQRTINHEGRHFLSYCPKKVFRSCS